MFYLHTKFRLNPWTFKNCCTMENTYTIYIYIHVYIYMYTDQSVSRVHESITGPHLSLKLLNKSCFISDSVGHWEQVHEQTTGGNVWTEGREINT